MFRSLIALVLIAAPTVTFAAPTIDAAADRALEAESAALPTPSLDARLKARAAAARIAIRTADTLGLTDEASATRVGAAADATPVVVALRARAE